ncbi:uncharacterized protein METZ01_LOCUS102287 [marine metagenome]|uniref:Uncharacterized protein n=1 Tax=marine metagenome TaxID=408172 RepID=A0A381WBX2_9ZZZZ
MGQGNGGIGMKLRLLIKQILHLPVFNELHNIEMLEIANRMDEIHRDVILTRKYLGFKNTEELWEAVNGEESE